MSSKPSKGGISHASAYWVITIAGAVVYELAMLAWGHKGGALSHVVWWAMGDPYTWRWAAVGAPILGLLAWCVPHFAFQWGEGLHLLIIIGAVFIIMATAVLVR